MIYFPLYQYAATFLLAQLENKNKSIIPFLLLGQQVK